MAVRSKRSCSISYDAKALRLARRRAHEKTETFREKYRFRAGAEGTMSDLDRITGLKHLRVRGMPRVRLAAVLKATGLNIIRAATFKNRQKNDKPRPTIPIDVPNWLAGIVKERLKHFLGHPRQLWGSFFSENIPATDFIAQAS